MWQILGPKKLTAKRFRPHHPHGPTAANQVTSYVEDTERAKRAFPGQVINGRSRMGSAPEIYLWILTPSFDPAPPNPSSQLPGAPGHSHANTILLSGKIFAVVNEMERGPVSTKYSLSETGLMATQMSTQNSDANAAANIRSAYNTAITEGGKYLGENTIMAKGESSMGGKGDTYSWYITPKPKPTEKAFLLTDGYAKAVSMRRPLCIVRITAMRKIFQDELKSLQLRSKKVHLHPSYMNTIWHTNTNKIKGFRGLENLADVDGPLYNWVAESLTKNKNKVTAEEMIKLFGQMYYPDSLCP